MVISLLREQYPASPIKWRYKICGKAVDSRMMYWDFTADDDSS